MREDDYKNVVKNYLGTIFFFSYIPSCVFCGNEATKREREREREKEREKEREREREHFFSPLVSLSFSQNFSSRVFNFFFVF